MGFKKLISATEHIMDVLFKPLNLIAFAVTTAMVLVVTINVLGRYLFHLPLLGTIELVEVMMSIIAAIALPLATLRRANVRVDVLVSRLSKRLQVVLGVFIFFLNAGTYALLASQALIVSIDNAKGLDIKRWIATEAFSIPLFPFFLVLFLGFLFVCIISFVSIFDPLGTRRKTRDGSVT